MKLTFLGTSHGVPAGDRHCSCMMLEVNGAVYVIDAGAPVVDCMLRQGVDLRRLRALFVTHAHSDHTVGVLHLADLINWYFTDCAADLYLTDGEQIELLKHLIPVMDRRSPLDESRVRFRLARKGEVYADENIRVEYIPTDHMGNGDPSNAILVTAGQKKILFSGDFSGSLRSADVPPVLWEERTDAFVCELAHFEAAQIAPYLEKAKTKRVYFNHVYPLSKYADIAAMAEKFSFTVLAPNDGDSYEIE